MSQISSKVFSRIEKLDLKTSDVVLFHVPERELIKHQNLGMAIRAALDAVGFEGMYILLPDHVKLDHLTADAQKRLGISFEQVRWGEITRWKIPEGLLPKSGEDELL